VLLIFVIHKESILKTFYKGIYGLIFILSIFLLLSSCSTKKNKWYNRAYYTSVAHYNTLWNGHDAFRQGIRTINTTQKEDYSQILPIFKKGDDQITINIKPNMDRAIEKSSKSIKKHSMFIDGKERNPEIKKAYLLIGKSSFYKKEYKVANATFKYIINTYKDKDIAFEAMIWLGFTFSKEKDYLMCESTLDQVKNRINEGKAPKSLRKFLYSVYAENAIAQGKNAKALEYIQLARKYSNSRSFNTRLMFIEGQFHLKANNLDQAGRLFSKTSKRAKDFDMQFASQLFQAMCYDPKTSNSKRILDKLEKMSLEKKNIMLRDQIYFTIGEIYFKDKNVDKACEYWEKSVNNSVNNDNQKISSSIRYSDVNFEILEEYEKAYIYYDTALFVMKKDHPNYNRVNSRQLVLENLVKNLRIVNRWDSLLALSNLTEAELNLKINNWINTFKAEQERIKKEEQARQAMLQNANAANPYAYQQQQSSWYFYNNNTVQAGKTEFIRIWGNRKLEDNWRLSQKQQEFDFDIDSELADGEIEDSISDSSGTKTSVKSKSLDKLSREYYTQDIPRTQHQKDSANIEISKALLTAGYIYYQGLQNNGKAISTFLELQKRYPNYPTTLPSSYHLYRIYDNIGQTPNSNYYKNIILNNYPESDFAYMIKNPDYWQEVSKQNIEAQALYEKAYNAYTSGKYNQAIELSKDGIDSLEYGPYIPRMLYIEALAKGKLSGMDTLIQELNMIVFNYPNHEITPVIENQLKYLSANYNIVSQNLAYKHTPKGEIKNKEIEGKDEKDEIKEISHADIIDHTVSQDDILDAESLIYRYRDMEHFYVILFDDDKVNVSEIRTAFSDFNTKYFTADNIKLTSLLFTMSKQMITVNRFENIEKAMQYYNTIINSKELLEGINPDYYTHFIISTQNYPTFYNRKNIPAYNKFFRIFYLEKEKNKK